MKKIVLGLAVLAGAMMLKAPTLQAATDTSGLVPVLAKIRGGIQITAVGGTTLDFGEIVVDSAALTGSIVLSGGPANTYNCTSGCASVVTPGNNAQFWVVGAPSQEYNIAYGGGVLSCLAGSGNCASIPTVTFSSYSVNGEAAGTAAGKGLLADIAGGRDDDLYIGGTLSFDPLTADGDYSGTFDVTVSFP